MERPSCDKHSDSTVRRDGYYGTSDQYQRWKCVPENGDSPHLISGELRRKQIGGEPGACPECGREWEPGEGMPKAQTDAYTLRDKAAALAALGRGTSYRQTGFLVRRRAMVSDLRGEPPSLSRTGRLTRDWVGRYTPVLADHYLPDEWPEVLVLDELPFHARDPDAKDSLCFVVLAALSYNDGTIESLMNGGTRTPVMWAMGADTDKSNDAWRQFLAQLDGEPRYVVCDRSSGMVKAIERLWSMAEIYHCSEHLRQNIETKLRTGGLRGTSLADLLDHRTFTNPLAHARFRKKVEDLRESDDLSAHQKDGLEELEGWFEDNRETVVRALHHWHRPVSTGGLERPLREVKNSLYDRRVSFTNLPRLRHLLDLMTMSLRDQDDELAWSELLRRHHLELKGRPPKPPGLTGTDERILRPWEK